MMIRVPPGEGLFIEANMREARMSSQIFWSSSNGRFNTWVVIFRGTSALASSTPIFV